MPQFPGRLRSESKTWSALGGLLACLALGQVGCASFWDDVTSSDFSLKTWYNPPDPLTVLRDSTDGNQRMKALLALKEPKTTGGTDADQEVVVKILITAASAEKQPLCRLAAIQTLGHFKDPRAVSGLIDAFYAANMNASPDTATVLRCTALNALGETKNPAAVELLARVVKEPPAEGPEIEKQQGLDVRIAAARALGNFSHYQATDSLVAILRTEKDVALRDRAYESLKQATGKDLPPDAQAWQQAIYQTPANGEPGKKINLLSWFSS